MPLSGENMGRTAAQYLLQVRTFSPLIFADFSLIKKQFLFVYLTNCSFLCIKHLLLLFCLNSHFSCIFFLSTTSLPIIFFSIQQCNNFIFFLDLNFLLLFFYFCGAAPTKSVENSCRLSTSKYISWLYILYTGKCILWLQLLPHSRQSNALK